MGVAAGLILTGAILTGYLTVTSILTAIWTQTTNLYEMAKEIKIYETITTVSKTGLDSIYSIGSYISVFGDILLTSEKKKEIKDYLSTNLFTIGMGAAAVAAVAGVYLYNAYFGSASDEWLQQNVDLYGYEYNSNMLKNLLKQILVNTLTGPQIVFIFKSLFSNLHYLQNKKELFYTLSPSDLYILQTKGYLHYNRINTRNNKKNEPNCIIKNKNTYRVDFNNTFIEKNTYEIIEDLCGDNKCEIFLHNENVYENHLLNNMKSTFYKTTIDSENSYTIEKNNDLLKSVLKETELYYRISVNNDGYTTSELADYSDWIPLSNPSSDNILSSLNTYLSRQHFNHSVKKRYQLTDSYKNDIFKIELDNEIKSILSNTHEFMSSIEGVFNEYTMCTNIDNNRHSPNDTNLDFVLKAYETYVTKYQAETETEKNKYKKYLQYIKLIYSYDEPLILENLSQLKDIHSIENNFIKNVIYFYVDNCITTKTEEDISKEIKQFLVEIVGVKPSNAEDEKMTK